MAWRRLLSLIRTKILRVFLLLRSERSEQSSNYNLAYKAIKAEKILISSVLHFVSQSLAFYSLPQCLGALEAPCSGLCAAT